MHAEVHYTNIEGVIPNSHVVLIPPSPGADNDALPVRANRDWHKSLYLHPGDWITWVILVLIAVVIVLAGVIYLLHSNEKVSQTQHYITLSRANTPFDPSFRQREDELERRKAMHRINFQAL
jgi:integrin alpha FG-GAP repeat containing protein 1